MLFHFLIFMHVGHGTTLGDDDDDDDENTEERETKRARGRPPGVFMAIRNTCAHEY